MKRLLTKAVTICSLAAILGLSSIALAAETWTMAAGELDAGDWYEVYGNGSPGSPGTELYGEDTDFGPEGPQWRFFNAIIPSSGVTVLDSGPWEYRTTYEGGTLSLGDRPLYWGNSIDIPMTVTNYSRHDPQDGDLEFHAIGSGKAGGFYWIFEASYSGPDNEPEFTALWESLTGEVDKDGHSGSFDWITLTRAAVPIETWTMAAAELDPKGGWLEAYGDGNPGSVGSELYALDVPAGTEGRQWTFSGATTIDPPTALEDSSPWQYKTAYMGGILSLSARPALWGDAIEIPMTVTNYSRHVGGPNSDGDLEFYVVGTSMAGGISWRFEASFRGPERTEGFTEYWKTFTGEADQVGHFGYFDWIRLTRSPFSCDLDMDGKCDQKDLVLLGDRPDLNGDGIFDSIDGMIFSRDYEKLDARYALCACELVPVSTDPSGAIPRFPRGGDLDLRLEATNMTGELVEEEDAVVRFGAKVTKPNGVQTDWVWITPIALSPYESTTKFHKHADLPAGLPLGTWTYQGFMHLKNKGFIAACEFDFELVNAPPILELRSVETTVEQGSPVTISWIDTDPDDNALINLAYDSDCELGGHRWITAYLKEDPDDSRDSYVWNTSGVTPGTYAIWGTINDGTNPEVFSCAEGFVVVEPPTESPE